MIYDLATLARARRKRGLRRDLLLPDANPPQTQADALMLAFVPVLRFWKREGDDILDRIEAGTRVVFDSAERTQSDLTSAAARAETVLSMGDAAILAWAYGVLRWHRARWVGTVRRRTGVEVDNLLGDLSMATSVRLLIEWATALLRDVSRGHQAAYAAALFGPTASTQEVATAMRMATVKARNRSRLIARDQTQKLAAALTQARHEEAGIKAYVWQHSFRKNPRRHHVERQGNEYTWARPPYDGHPGTQPNCRCTALAVIAAG